MKTTTPKVAQQRREYPLLVIDGTWDPDEPPFDVWDNVWSDRPFWITYTIESYYAELGRARQHNGAARRAAKRRTPNEHAEAIIGEVALTMFGGDAADDPACRAAAWDAIVTEMGRAGSRVVVRLPKGARLIAVCDSAAKAARFHERQFGRLAARLMSGNWINEHDRQCARVVA